MIALYLSELRERAGAITGQPITSAVLGRPVNFGSDDSFNALAEKRLRAAAELAGFDDIVLELEPVAAALAYERSLTRPQHILVFDFGGGTLDLTVMQVGGRERAVLATGGIDVAGDTFDREIIRYRLLDHFGRGTTIGQRKLPFPIHLTESLTRWQEIPTLSTPETLRLLDEAQRTGDHPSRVRALESLVVNNYGFALFDAVERAKRELSDDHSAVVYLQARDIDLWQLLTRAQFEIAIASHRHEIAERVRQTVRRSGLEPGQIDAVVRTGGSSQIPCFVALLAEQFGAEKLRRQNTFSGVTAGLAIRAWELER
ncbi:MAG: Hsp70 family protein [Delftia sp.]|nr:Hsp70 family protein [Delftia sp.]